MPGFDRTGPMGRGSRSGRGRGACGTAGCGFAMGMGGSGFRRRLWARDGGVFVDEQRRLEEELASMKARTEALEERLRAAESR